MSNLFLPRLMSNIVDKGIVNGDTPYIIQVGSYMMLVALFGGACTAVASFIASKTSMGFGRDLRKRLFAHVESFSLNEFDKIGTPSLITRTTNDITQIQMVVMMMMRMMLMAPIMCIGGIIMAVSTDAKLSLLLAVVIPIMALLLTIITKKSMPMFKAMQKKIDRINLVLRENLTGIRVIRAFNRIEQERKRFSEANTDLADVSIRANVIMAGMMPFTMFIMNLATVAIIWFGGIRVNNGGMQIGELMAFIQYATEILMSINGMSFILVMLPRASASSGRINEVLDTVPGIRDAEVVKSTAGKKGYVEFRDVCFSYPGAEQPAISDISFSAFPGEITAIIGGTGSGKSTLINLLPRFYDIDLGSVMVDGVDVREISQEELRSKIGYVPQKAVLFTGTVEGNIRYGKQDASMEEVRHAAEVAQSIDFIEGMNEGFKSYIAQGGTNVSGGQKQRLSIARALARKPEIYIFDDSFSALDFKTDARLRAALKKEIADATVIIVAQRVSTIMDADRIIVLEEGRISGMGNHRELLSSCGVYREIVSSQLSEEEIA